MLEQVAQGEYLEEGKKLERERGIIFVMPPPSPTHATSTDLFLSCTHTEQQTNTHKNT